MSKSTAEILLSKHLDELGLKFEREVRIHSERKWRLDFYLPEHRIGIEVDGYHNGRHGAGWGAGNDKRNYAEMSGTRVLTFSTNDVNRGRAKEFLKFWLRKA
jgi:very-short-patch-repair endonuclease